MELQRPRGFPDEGPDGVRRRWVVAVIAAVAVAVIAAAAVLSGVRDLPGTNQRAEPPPVAGGGLQGGVREPAGHYAQIAGLDLGTTRQSVQGLLGPARGATPLCRHVRCTRRAAAQNLRVELYQAGPVAVRAIFTDTGLAWYTVTLLSNQLDPPIPMTWSDTQIGSLGRTTYVEALRLFTGEPTDLHVFIGERSVSYAEVYAGGGAGGFRGLVLASAPTPGWSGPGFFDRRSAERLYALQEAGRGSQTGRDSEAARTFRSRTRPNTFGEFTDDGGPLARLARHAGFDRAMLHLFTADARPR